MVHTLKDYTTKYKLAKIFGNVDNAELAARLGACSTMDRRGNLIWADDFEAAVASKWGTSVAAGGTVTLSTDRAWMGNQSIKLLAPNALGSSAAIVKAFCLPIERKIATEFMFCMTTGKPIVELRVIGYTGTYYFDALIMYNHNTGKLYYGNSAGAWVELTLTDSTALSYEPWLLVKLAMDWDTKKYIRFIFCSTEYDLSAISMHSAASATAKHVEVYIYNSPATAADATVYIDNFILTQNE